MRNARIYQAQSLTQGDEIHLDAQATAHIVRVLRLKPGDPVTVFNGEGGEYFGRIERIDKRSTTVRLLEYHQLQVESPLHVSLIQGISRGDRMEYTLQKSVELGVNEFYPVMTQHTVVQLDAVRKDKKLQHWQGIVISACEQSGRDTIPQVQDISGLYNCIECFNDQSALKIFLDPRAESSFKQIERPAQRILLVVGPEGGLSNEETDWLVNKGFIGVALGPRILRTETAAVVALSAMQVLWGDFQ